MPINDPTPDGEYKASWLELFYDLVFVALVAQLTYEFSKHHSTVKDFLNIFIVGYMIFYAWWNTTASRNLKQKDDLLDIVSIQAQMVLIVIMGLTLPKGFTDQSQIFFASFTLHGIISLFLLRRFYTTYPKKRSNTLNIWWGFLSAYVLWFTAGFLSGTYLYIFAFLGLAVHFFTPFTKGKGNKVTLLNMNHFLERVGLFLLVVMGEAVLVVALVNSASAKLDFFRIGIVLCGLLQMVSLWWLYFPFIESKDISKRARWFMVLLHSHGILYGSLIFIAAGLKTIINSPEANLEEYWIFVLGLAVMIAAFNSIRVSLHYPLRKGLISLISYVLILAIVTTIAIYFELSSVTLVALTTAQLLVYAAVQSRSLYCSSGLLGHQKK